jgi:small subunit ribosomal protein S9
LATREAYYATGKRKDAVARVWVRPGQGRVWINGLLLSEYLERPAMEAWVLQPLAIAGKLGQLDVKAKVAGGGKSGQAGAVRHGLARALVAMDPNLRPVLSAYRLLTRDPRVKERKHAGFRSARRGKQFSKR